MARAFVRSERADEPGAGRGPIFVRSCGGEEGDGALVFSWIWWGKERWMDDGWMMDDGRMDDG